MVRDGCEAHDDGMTSSPRTLTRSTTETYIAGVSGGLGRYFDVDPVLFRVGFAVTALVSGVGLLAYLILWAIIPRDDQATAGVGPHVGARAG
jgi:phage shock protein PspC (stress-responsive transcriptional regulator)